MRNVKLFFYLCAFLLLTWSSAVAATPTLTLGGATVDATGTMVTIPVILTNVTGRSISGVETHVRFNNVSDVFALKMSGASVISATPGPVATAAGKQLSEGSQAYGGKIPCVAYRVYRNSGNAALTYSIALMMEELHTHTTLKFLLGSLS